MDNIQQEEGQILNHHDNEYNFNRRLNGHRRGKMLESTALVVVSVVLLKPFTLVVAKETHQAGTVEAVSRLEDDKTDEWSGAGGMLGSHANYLRPNDMLGSVSGKISGLSLMAGASAGDDDMDFPPISSNRHFNHYKNQHGHSNSNHHKKHASSKVSSKSKTVKRKVSHSSFVEKKSQDRQTKSEARPHHVVHSVKSPQIASSNLNDISSALDIRGQIDKEQGDEKGEISSLEKSSDEHQKFLESFGWHLHKHHENGNANSPHSHNVPWVSYKKLAVKEVSQKPTEVNFGVDLMDNAESAIGFVPGSNNHNNPTPTKPTETVFRNPISPNEDSPVSSASVVHGISDNGMQVESQRQVETNTEDAHVQQPRRRTLKSSLAVAPTTPPSQVSIEEEEENLNTNEEVAAVGTLSTSTIEKWNSQDKLLLTGIWVVALVVVAVIISLAMLKYNATRKKVGNAVPMDLSKKELETLLAKARAKADRA